MIIFPWQQSYLDELSELAEMAFARWQRSGYRDIESHDTWLRWRQKAIQHKARIRAVTDRRVA